MADRVRRAAKIDANQPEVVDHLRRAGWSVHVTAPLGDGFPDLAVACGRFTALVEVKDGNKRLTQAEQDFQEAWTGVYIIGRNAEQTLRDLERARLEATE